MTKQKQLKIIAIEGIPEIKNNDNISIIIYNACRHFITINTNDIFIITQKIISKSENRYINLLDITPSIRALEIAQQSEKDPRLVQLILNESSKILRVRKGLIIVRHKLGFICANAGIDHSNTVAGDPEKNIVLLLPENPDQSAARIQQELKDLTHHEVGVMIIDSHGRAWRNGTVGTAIGIAGVPGLVDLRGKKDRNGYILQATQVAAADELAAAASLLMGQADESIPCVIARGFPYPLRNSCLNELIRPEENDLFL